jgi:hypothetical protein
MYAIKPEHTLIYFDHKLADSVSVPSKLLAEPIAYNTKTKDIYQYRVIENCEKAEYITSRGLQLDYETPVFDFDVTSTCPLAFYKTIGYTWNGKLMDGVEDLDVLDILRSGAI